MTNEIPTETDGQTVEVGETVHDEEGTVVGVVQSVSSGTFTVDTVDEATVDGSFDSDENVPGDEFGEGYLMWRCTECGEMGDLDGGRPDNCPNCGAPRDAIAKARED
ncbi:DUF7130 family rubredoxin-like protein [Haloarcula salina]|uniref:DUF7130 domain-containing protein n=1 Tax=Haloarcula salina TaxID=1429914 RepID=A0AA41G4U6_9EURY|nr:hypothetical protein [Haloarcula salina]MBV0903524.1 hypothetical protein [Haloarcula salina]